MPYFTPARPNSSLYYCPNCKAWFEPSNMSCLVAHPSGTCCHKYETRVDLEAGQPLSSASDFEAFS